MKILGKPRSKFLPASDSVSKKIFDKMIELQLLSMNEDSLNYKHSADYKIKKEKWDGMNIVDAPDYIFFVETPNSSRTIECYAPNEFYEFNPSVLQRKNFIDFRNLYESYWQK